ncbi:MAG: hypothetical protein ACREK1_08955, partial [Longimicrobiales bacterium]
PRCAAVFAAEDPAAGTAPRLPACRRVGGEAGGSLIIQAIRPDDVARGIDTQNFALRRDEDPAHGT